MVHHVFYSNPSNSSYWFRSPDGLSVLGHCEDGTLQLCELCVVVLGLSGQFSNREFSDLNPGWNRRAVGIRHRNDKNMHPSIPTDISVQPNVLLEQPSPTLDFLWYPTASYHDPASYCFVASVRECPVKLLDASSGRVSRRVPFRNRT
jgi:telomerase Cajal body protein 1